ncbi:hypothetical protein PP744_gp100 [Rhizobium phage RHph_N38]|uniref:Uncharacterized protein n=1 Tax=Rhizobium phage RHph_N38 TaxID=2509750 RepID=A0A7S5R9L9_9CAUD|nr:hypothetical protein PP744_gp100 [Rhizobium phage RHph_N38]QIG70555.1 hypothetical protein EVB89_094 [Rhizobium phage RHph_N38]
MIRTRILFMAAAIVAVMPLASCGTVAVTSERPRGITSEQENDQMNERIAKDKAERAAKAEADKARFGYTP